jgi:hypothetical protein
MSLSAPASDKVTLTLWPKHILRIIIRITYRAVRTGGPVCPARCSADTG